MLRERTAQRIKSLNAEPGLIRQVKDPPLFEVREALDFGDEFGPILRRQMIQFVGRPAENLRELKDGECTLLNPGGIHGSVRARRSSRS